MIKRGKYKETWKAKLYQRIRNFLKWHHPAYKFKDKFGNVFIENGYVSVGELIDR